ncbi:Glycosyl transferase, group 1 family protein [hydrothermal vent metagenome]|uniref:Glycosyl transferase, group 1 family protein n=1 Tax=hydrothermal vent metagenome TaxID=652676 RepID=A0A3B0SCD0_9ZZZZ
MTRPLNILTLSTLFPNAVNPNFGIFVERQAAELARRPKANVTVINPIGIPPWPLNKLEQYAPLNALPEHETWNGLKVHRPRFTLVPKIGGVNNPKSIADAIIPLVERLHQSQPFDLIDAEFFYPDGPAALRIHQALDIPFTIKARGADIHHWGSDPKCRPQILEAADKASGLLAVSSALIKDMASLGMDADKITVHYTGVDQELFKPVDRIAAKADMDFRGPLLITTGALISRKNQALVIRAIAEIPNATLLLAGSGEEESSYRKLAKDMGVANRIRFLGNLPHAELAKLTAAADISILVSKSEGLANAWVEALACGTPVIISAAGGARELVCSDVAGRIVDRDPQSIAQAVEEILEHPATQNDVRSTVSSFSWKNNGDQLLSFFQSVAKSNGV